MKNSRAVVLVIAIALTLFGMRAALQDNAVAQGAAGVPATGDDINPPVAHCNLTPDTQPAGPGQPPGARQPTPIVASLLTSGLPCAEVVNTAGLHENNDLLNLQRGFDFYSWLTFIALSSPADGSSIASSTQRTRAVWEDSHSFMRLADVMLPDGRAPAWGAQVVPPECQHDFKEGMTLIRVTEESYNQPFKTGPLIDQNGNYALFDILVNEPMFDFIRANRLYSKAGQAAFAHAIIFPEGVNPGPAVASAPGRVGALMLKVSYKILDPVKDQAVLDRFHTVDALIYLPATETVKSAVCVRKTLGLVGFHAVHKTKNRPQWIWTTFEHADNVPEVGDLENHSLQLRYNFYNPSCRSCPVNQTPPRSWTIGETLKFPRPFASQIVRTTPLRDDAPDLNRDFQAVLQKTVWRHYMLVSTQWPSDFTCAQNPSVQSDPTCAPAPTFLANSTLETYSQAEVDNPAAKLPSDTIGAVPMSTSSCIACHSNATTVQRQPATSSDFTFTLEKAH